MFILKRRNENRQLRQFVNLLWNKEQGRCSVKVYSEPKMTGRCGEPGLPKTVTFNVHIKDKRRKGKSPSNVLSF